MGAQKTPPSQTKRPWVPVTLCQQNKATKSQNRRGPTLRPQRGFPWPSLGLGAGRRAPRACRRSSHWLGLPVKRVKPQNKTKGENTNQGKEAKKHPCRLASQEKGPQKGRASSSPVSTRRIPKTRGAQNGTPKKTPRSRTHGQNGRNKQTRRDNTKRTRQSKTGACGGVLLLPELYLFKKQKKHEKRRRRKTQREERKNPKKHQT